MKLKIDDYQELTATEAKSIKGGSSPCSHWYNSQDDIDRCERIVSANHCDSVGGVWLNDRVATEDEESDLYGCYL